VPSVVAGSGLAATRGIPLSIGGSAPSIVQLAAESLIFNVPHRYTVRELEASARATGAAGAVLKDDVVWRTAGAYLELDKTLRALEAARTETSSLQKIEALAAERVQAGVDIPAELTRARLGTARNRQRVVTLQGQAEVLESTLKALLGWPEDRRLRTVPDSFAAPLDDTSAPEAESRAISRAVESSPELKRLAEDVAAKEFKVKAEKAQKYPQMDLIGQYALLSKTNNYEDFYRRFERHNLQLGLAVRIPIFDKVRINARVNQAEAELMEARHSLDNARRNIALQVRQLFQKRRQTEAAREVARLELELARENTRVLLAQFQEGRAGAREIEQARLEESARWNALLDTGFELDRTRLELLKTTGEIGKVLQ
jgi:outer membrane protein TolC